MTRASQAVPYLVITHEPSGWVARCRFHDVADLSSPAKRVSEKLHRTVAVVLVCVSV